MLQKNTVLAVVGASALAIGAFGASEAQALKGCVKAPKPALTESHHGAKVPLRLEPGSHARIERKLKAGTEVWIETEPRLKRICPTKGFYPVLFEDRVTYEEVWGWIRGSELR